MTPKEKAVELVEKFRLFPAWENRIESAIICIENEHHSLREQLFNLRACGVIKNEKTYLSRLQELIDQEEEVKKEIEKL